MALLKGGAGLESVSEKVADFVGLNNSRYQWVIDEYNVMLQRVRGGFTDTEGCRALMTHPADGLLQEREEREEREREEIAETQALEEGTSSKTAATV